MIDIFLSYTNKYFLSKNYPHTAIIFLSKMTFMPLCSAFSSPCAAGLTTHTTFCELGLVERPKNKGLKLWVFVFWVFLHDPNDPNDPSRWNAGIFRAWKHVVVCRENTALKLKKRVTAEQLFIM